MEFRDLILKNRSYRRFDQSFTIDYKILENLVDFARCSPSAANRQPMKYLIYNSPSDCARIFPSLVWAGYLKDWKGAEEGEKPSAYVIILGDKNITEEFGIDPGIAAQSIMLGATESGIGGCMIASIKRGDLRNELKIPYNFDILLVLALGKPVENVILEEIKDDDIRYWRDNEKNHHVPKRNLNDLIIKL